MPSTATPRLGPRSAAELSVRLRSRRPALPPQARPESPLYLPCISPCRHGLSRLAEEISVELDLRTLRELQPLEELRQRLRGTDLGTDVTDL